MKLIWKIGTADNDKDNGTGEGTDNDNDNGIIDDVSSSDWS